jgi:coniferyl-aldehyde dehydrogenase
LAFYAYSKDSQPVDWYLYNTISGGVTINDSLLHVSVHSLPFGGIGNSGMGHYHGYEGFTTFSKMRPVLYQGPIRTLNMMLPPYGPRTQKILDFMIKLKS